MLSRVKTSEVEVAQQKRLLVELLLQSNQTEIQTEVYPASLAQQRLWFLISRNSVASFPSYFIGSINPLRLTSWPLRALTASGICSIVMREAVNESFFASNIWSVTENRKAERLSKLIGRYGAG